jgi:hypothetical protein
MTLARCAVLLALACMPACSTVRVELPECPFKLRGECVGVPMGAVCEDEFCTEGASCVRVIEVHDDAELAAGVASASSGDCLALARGAYTSVTLPQGVSLLGRSASSTSVEGVTVRGGTGALIRGIEIRAGGLSVAGGAELTVHAVRVKGSAGDGIIVEENARLWMSRSEVVSPAARGIRGVDFGHMVITGSAVGSAPAAGFWAQCGMGCDCPARPPVAIEHSLIQRPGTYGLALIGVSVSIENSDVNDTVAGLDFQIGAAVAASGCTELTLSDVHVVKSAGVGLLVNESSAQLGVEGSGISVSNASQGVVITQVGADQRVDMVEATIEDSAGVGVCIGGFSSLVSIKDSSIARTRMVLLPLSPGGSAEVGDGLEWTAESQVQIDGLNVKGSQRESVLIDGPVAEGSRIENLTLSGGDEQKGIKQQKVLNDSDAPEVGPGVPPVQQSPEPLWSLPCP